MRLLPHTETWRRSRSRVLVILAAAFALIAALALAGPGAQRRGRDPALPGQARHRLLHRERRPSPPPPPSTATPAPAGPAPSADPQWLQVDLGATATISQVVLNWEAAYAHGLPDPDLGRRHHLDDDLLHHHRHRRHPDPERHRHRPVRAACTAPQRATQYGYSPVGVPGLRHRRAAPARVQHRPTPRSTSPADRVVAGERDASRRRRRSTATPAPAGPARSATRSGSRSTSARAQTICQVTPELGGRLREGVPDPGLARRRRPGPRSTPPPPAPAAPRPSTSPGPAATCGCTAPPGPRRTATRCGSSASTPPAGGHRPPRPRRPPVGGGLGAPPASFWGDTSAIPAATTCSR